MNPPHVHPPRLRRSRLFRCSAFAWAVVFLLGSVRAGFAEVACPHHGGADGSATAEAPAGVEAPAGHGHSGHGHGHGQGAADGDAGSAAGAAADPETPHGSHEDHDGCRCIGPCHAPAAVALPGAGGTPDLVAFAENRAAVAAIPAEALPGRPPHSLPFATAPPSAR